MVGSKTCNFVLHFFERSNEIYLKVEIIADVVKLVDTPDLGSGAERCAGSSPSIRTNRSRCRETFFV